MNIDRRRFVSSAAITAAATSVSLSAILPSALAAEDEQPKDVATWQDGRSPWPMCLDTTTLAKDLPLERKIELTAGAGFDAIEPWDRELTSYEKAGGDLKELGQKIKEAGLFVPSVIGLWGALANNDEDFDARLDEQRDRMRMISAIGSQHVQVIPDFKNMDKLTKEGVARSYRRISEIALKEYGLETGIVFLNAVKGLQTIRDATEVAMMSNWPNAKIIPDTYHNFHGRSNINSLKYLNPNFIAIFQFGDSPEGLEPQKGWSDKHRVLPGDGVLPLVEQLKTLRDIGYTGCVSLELYNPEYRKREPVAFLKEAHRKTLAVIEASGG